MSDSTVDEPARRAVDPAVTPGAGLSLRPQAPALRLATGGPAASDLFSWPLGNILQAAHEAIVMVDARHRITALNPAAEQMFRCPAEQALGTLLDRFIPADAAAPHGALIDGFAASPELQQRLTQHRHVRGRRADGTEFPASVTLSPVDLASAGGVQRHCAALMLDLSEENQLRDELERFNRRLRSVFELAPVAIWIAEDDRIVFANHAAERLFGGDGELVGRHIYDLLSPGSHPEVRAQMARALAGDPDIALVRGDIVRPDGVACEVEIALAALPDHGHTTVQMAVADVTQRRREAKEMEHSRETLRRLSTSVVEAREEERRRIARELHDELGQRLTALKMELSTVATVTDLALRQERFDLMQQMLDETLGSVRRIASDLRPLMLDDLGLLPAIEWLARDAGRRMGIEVTVRLCEVEPEVDNRVATAVFRMVQEALTNVARHARATDVHIGLEQADGQLVLSVEDNGVGYPERAMQRSGSYGLLGLRERATMLGGQLEYSNPPGRGARLTVRLPLNKPRAGDAADPEGGPP